MGQNVLEAMVLLVTSKEINDGRFTTFVKQLADIPWCDLTFVIMTNNTSHKPIGKDVELIMNKFKAIEVISVDILPFDDIYMLTNPVTKPQRKHILFHKYVPTTTVIPKYGNASGPNMMFLSAMDYCRKFNTTLLIETDCIVKPDFLTKLSLFTEYSGGFLIAGSTYDGTRYSSPNTLGFFHLNGVALYNTGSKEFQTLVQNVDAYIVEHVKKETFVAYDYAITQMVLNYILDHSKHAKWKHIYKQLIKTNYIVNMSTIEDKEVSVAHVNKLYPNHVILHKKS